MSRHLFGDGSEVARQILEFIVGRDIQRPDTVAARELPRGIANTEDRFCELVGGHDRHPYHEECHQHGCEQHGKEKGSRVSREGRQRNHSVQGELLPECGAK